MRYQVTHITCYEYEQKVNACYNRAYLLPRETAYQNINTPIIMINPVPTVSNRRIDYFGNHAYHFSLTEPHQHLSIEVVTVAKLSENRQNIMGELAYGATCSEVLERVENPKGNVETLYAREFLLPSPMVGLMPELVPFAQDCFSPDKPFLTAVSELNSKIYREFEFESGSTVIATPIREVLNNRRGVCQDFSHLAIACMRSLGYPARYISGYLETLPPPGEKKLEGADASHAWFSVFSPGEGWFEFDPTNNSTPYNQHIVTAWGRDYSDVSPLRGIVYGGGQSHSLNVSVDVKRLA